MRVVDIDARRSGCPGNFKLVSAADRLDKVCVGAVNAHSGGCSSVVFKTHGVPYSTVRGYAYGRQVRIFFPSSMCAHAEYIQQQCSHCL